MPTAQERTGRYCKAPVRALALPEIVAEAWRAHPVVQEFEAHQALAWEYRENYDAMPPLLRKRLDESRDIAAADYDEARSVAEVDIAIESGAWTNASALPIAFSKPSRRAITARHSAMVR